MDLWLSSSLQGTSNHSMPAFPHCPFSSYQIWSTHLTNPVHPLAVPLNQAQVLPISAYKKPLFACTKAILCNIQYTTVWAIVSAWFILSICVYIKASWNSQTSTFLVSAWKGLHDSMYDIQNITKFISSSNGEWIEKQHFLCNYPFKG